jgi:hypothetical protein
MRKNMPVPASLVFHMPYSVFGSFAASCLVSPAFFMENALCAGNIPLYFDHKSGNATCAANVLPIAGQMFF